MIKYTNLSKLQCHYYYWVCIQVVFSRNQVTDTLHIIPEHSSVSLLILIMLSCLFDAFGLFFFYRILLIFFVKLYGILSTTSILFLTTFHFLSVLFGDFLEKQHSLSNKFSFCLQGIIFFCSELVDLFVFQKLISHSSKTHFDLSIYHWSAGLYPCSLQSYKEIVLLTKSNHLFYFFWVILMNLILSTGIIFRCVLLFSLIYF